MLLFHFLMSLPIGSMYAIYGNIYHQYSPFMLALIYQHHGSVMGYWCCWPRGLRQKPPHSPPSHAERRWWKNVLSGPRIQVILVAIQLSNCLRLTIPNFDQYFSAKIITKLQLRLLELNRIDTIGVALKTYKNIISGWWFGTVCIFPYIGNNNPN